MEHTRSPLNRGKPGDHFGEWTASELASGDVWRASTAIAFPLFWTQVHRANGHASGKSHNRTRASPFDWGVILYRLRKRNEKKNEKEKNKRQLEKEGKFLNVHRSEFFHYFRDFVKELLLLPRENSPSLFSQTNWVEIKEGDSANVSLRLRATKRRRSVHARLCALRASRAFFETRWKEAPWAFMRAQDRRINYQRLMKTFS